MRMTAKRVLLAWISAALALAPLWSRAEVKPFPDDFNGRSGKRPEAWTVSDGVPPIGLYYIIDNGEFCTGNGQDLSVPGGWTFATVNREDASAWDDYSVSVDFRAKRYNGRTIVVGRFQDPLNHYQAYLDVSRTLEGRQRKAGIEVVQGGSHRLLGSEAVDGIKGASIPQIEGMRTVKEDRNLTVVFYKDQITMILDGKPLVSVRDSTFARGTAGVGMRYNEVIFDNFRVTPVNEASGAVQQAARPTSAPEGVKTAAPAPEGVKQEPATFYWVSMGEDMKEDEARALKNSVAAKGFSNVRFVEENGKWRVLVGAFLSQKEANDSLAMLNVEGLKPERIVQTAPAEAPASEETALLEYRVISQTYRDQAKARMLKDALIEGGYTSADIINEGPAYGVVVGPYPSSKDAQSVLDKMKTEGYLGMSLTTKEVVSLTKDIAALASGDIDRVVQAQMDRVGEQNRASVEALVRSLLATMLKETESRTAGEIKDIRDRLAGVEDQKALVAQLNSDIEAEKKRKEKAGELLDGISEAIENKDWAKAETVVDELKTLDPRNPQIDIKRETIQLGKLGITNIGDYVQKSYEDLRKDIKKLNFTSEADVQMAVKTANSFLEQSKTKKEYVALALVQFESIKITADGLVDKPDITPQLAKALKDARDEAEKNIAPLRQQLRGQTEDQEKVAQAAQKLAASQKMIWYVIFGVFGVLLLFIVTLVLVIRSQHKRHREILALVSEIPMRPVLPVGEQKKELGAEAGPGELGMSESVGAGLDAALGTAEPDFSASGDQQVVVTAGSDREASAPGEDFFEKPTAIQTLGEGAPGAEGAPEFDISASIGEVPTFGEEEKTQESLALEETPTEPAPIVVPDESEVISFAELESLQSSPGGEAEGVEPPGLEAPVAFGEAIGTETTAEEPLGLSIPFETEPGDETAPAAAGAEAVASASAAPSPVEDASFGLLELNLDDLAPAAETVPPSAAGTSPAAAQPADVKETSAPAEQELDLSDILGSSAIPEVSAEPIAGSPAAAEEETLPTGAITKTAAPGGPVAPSSLPAIDDTLFDIAVAPSSLPADSLSLDMLEEPLSARAETVSAFGVQSPVVAPAPAAAAMAPGTVVFEENVKDSAAGERAHGWTGEYPYASLTVDTATPPGGASKYLKFEKNNGAGSAYFSRTFPDASGAVCVEFDVCCKDKNKYLLGFYIEKDGDFRQSIHTIIHRTDPQGASALRIQGESTPYRFGEWAHVRYEINLNEGVVNGSVNGKPVAAGVKMASCPKSINTFSIRDNLATTGVLLIGGLKVTKIA